MQSMGYDGSRNANVKRLRVYQNWQGNERFFCNGFLVSGPNWKAAFGSAFLLLAPTGVFLAFVAPYLTTHVSPAIMVFSCLLPALCLFFLFSTACTDPGIIARQEPDEEWLAGQRPRTKDVIVNGHRVTIRYNDTCHFYQPPRAHHCSVNDNCIERFDHHCPWVGTTIGKRNYRTFLLFIYTSTVLCLYVFGCCLAQLFLKHNELVQNAQASGTSNDNLWISTLDQVPAALALMGYTFLFFWFVGGLSAFHCYLVGTNQSTYENFRYNYDSRPNPFDRGVFRNCGEVWCTRVPKSQVNFRAYVDEYRPPKPEIPYMEAPPENVPQQSRGATPPVGSYRNVASPPMPILGANNPNPNMGLTQWPQGGPMGQQREWGGMRSGEVQMNRQAVPPPGQEPVGRRGQAYLTP